MVAHDSVGAGSRLRRVAGPVYLVAIVLAMALFAQRQGSEVLDVLRNVEIWPLLASFLLATTHLTLITLIWIQVLGVEARTLPARTSAGLFLVSQMGKYIPGSVWPIVVQMQVAGAYGVTRAAVARAFAVNLGLAITSASAVILGLSPLIGLPAGLRGGPVLLSGVLVGAGIVLVLTASAVHGRFRAIMQVFVRTTPQVLVSGTALQLVAWTAMGGHLYLLMRAVGFDDDLLFARSVSGFALAFLAGLVVIMAPAGAGVREGVLVLLLAPASTDVPAVAAAALLSRLLLTITDASAFGIGHYLGRSAPPETAPSA